LSDISSKFSTVAAFGIRDSKRYFICFVKIGKLVLKKTKEGIHTHVVWWSEKWPTNSMVISKMTFPKKQKGINKDNFVLVYLINVIELFQVTDCRKWRN